MPRGSRVKFFVIEKGVTLSALAEELGLVLKDKVLKDRNNKIAGIIMQNLDESKKNEFIMASEKIFELCKKSKHLREVTQKEAWGF